MGNGARRRTYTQITTAAVAGGGGAVVLPAVSLPSVPFLNEDATPAAFRKVTIQAAGITDGATVPANWALVASVQFQPMRSGPVGIFTLPAASVSNLTILHDWLAVPGASLHITATNNGGAASAITISYGGAVSPNWTDLHDE